MPPLGGWGLHSTYRVRKLWNLTQKETSIPRSDTSTIEKKSRRTKCIFLKKIFLNLLDTILKSKPLLQKQTGHRPVMWDSPMYAVNTIG